MKPELGASKTSTPTTTLVDLVGAFAVMIVGVIGVGLSFFD